MLRESESHRIGNISSFDNALHGHVLYERLSKAQLSLHATTFGKYGLFVLTTQHAQRQPQQSNGISFHKAQNGRGVSRPSRPLGAPDCLQKCLATRRNYKISSATQHLGQGAKVLRAPTHRPFRPQSPETLHRTGVHKLSGPALHRISHRVLRESEAKCGSNWISFNDAFNGREVSNFHQLSIDNKPPRA